MNKNNTMKTKDNFAVLAHNLLMEQLKEWNLAKDNYNDLKKVKTKIFEFGNFNIKIQFNPGRIVSSSAKVDKKSISERKCFLCLENLPKEQKGINILDNYTLLVNPFPIFPEHFTIPLTKHLPQHIKDYFYDMLLITASMGSNYSLFYNGPKCGASAPDHFHFQAGLKNFMPLEYEYEDIVYEKGNLFYRNTTTEIYQVKNYLRNFISIESDSSEDIMRIWELIYSNLPVKEDETEPMMNLLTSYKNDKWRVNIFPRTVHRPTQFFAEGEEKILLSPASVDLGGVCITPREEDFAKITKEDLIDIYRQITMSDSDFDTLVGKIDKDL